jgi:flavin reductase (DIM6/NTAB) family NADH-FMN oxidoreductase RutF
VGEVFVDDEAGKGPDMSSPERAERSAGTEDEPPASTGLDDRTYDELIRTNNTSMVVVAASDGREVDACLVGFHCQCSIKPLRYAVWLSKANHTYRIAQNAPALAVHWLAQAERDVAVAVGSVTLDRDPDKMSRIAWQPGPDGAPVIQRAAGGVVGRIVDRHDDGDHVCFVLNPTAAWMRSEVEGVLRFRDVQDITPGHEADDPPAG